MKGISRKIDDLGRIVIPKELRNNLNIHVNDELEIYIKDNKIILEKYSKLDNIKDYITNLIKNINNVNKMNIFITDKEKIILTNESISDELRNIIESNIDKKDVKLKINDNVNSNCVVSIIKDNYLPIGSVVTIGDNLKEIDYKLTTFVEQMLSNYIAL